VNRSARISSSVLDDIVGAKRSELLALRPRLGELVAAAAAAVPVPDFEAALRQGPNVAVIAEMKRRSPSAGEIRGGVGAVDVARAYERAGVAAISVLTDGPYFGGSLADLEEVGCAVALPLLRKDFMLEDVQFHEARAAGASAVLLIVRILDDVQLRDFGSLAADLNMSALFEVHTEGEVERALAAGARIIGVNNRDLATFRTDLQLTVDLAPLVPTECVLVGESGIREVADVARLAAAGAGAVLVGESLMRAADPLAHARALTRVPRRSV
jgi:indole-3-glycerol phosphate synthase